MFPILYFWDHTEVTIYDNLDIVIPMSKMLAQSGMMFANSSDIVPNVMGGVPRFVLGSEYNIQLWLYYFFNDFTAYAINEGLMHIVGFLSMLVLLSHYFIPKTTRYRDFIIFSTSVLYGTVNFYLGAGLSVPLLPLALYAFLQIKYHHDTWKEWLILVFIPFYSNLILVYSFFLMLMGVFFIVDIYQNKKINIKFFLALLLLSALFLAVEYRLLYSMFFADGYQSHRLEFGAVQTVKSYFTMYKNAHGSFLNGLVNMPTYASVIIIPTTLIAIILSSFRTQLNRWISSVIIILFSLFIIKYTDWLGSIIGGKYFLPLLALTCIILYFRNKQYKLLYGAVLLQIFLAYLYAAWFLTDTAALGEYIPILKIYNFARFAYLQSAIWYIILALSLLVFTHKIKWSPLLIIMIIYVQAVSNMSTRKFKAPHSPLTYHSFYAPELFSKIKKYIGKPVNSYRVGSIGFLPAITIYNGLHTIDGYLPNYPLEYKHKFSKIINNTLLTNKELNNLYSNWGSKCYLFDANISFQYFDSKKILDNIDLNFDAYYNIGGRYLITTNKLADKYLDKLIFLKEFSDKNTFWKAYLYEVKAPLKK